MSKMRRILFLGAGTPTPHKSGFGTAFLLDIDGRKFLIDCGPSVTHKLAKRGFSPLDVDAIFLTHLHFDHCSGLPTFLLSYWDQSASPQLGLKIYGPRPTRLFVDKLIGPTGAFSYDINARINAPISQNTYINRGGILPRSYPAFIVNELTGKEIFKKDKIIVSVRKTKHAEPWLESIAYRFDFGDISVVFTGDTGSVDIIARLAKDCDVLVVNVWNPKANVSTSAKDESLATVATAARMGAKASAKKLILTHMGHRSGQKEEKNTSECLKEAKKIFSGEISIASESESFDLI
jgi:ribonuclease BN (tRNA processing enzyme)